MLLREIVLVEGGNAFDDVGRVSKDSIPSIIKTVRSVISGNAKNVIPIGSTGKKSFSGDIDLAVNSSEIDRTSAVAAMEEKFGRGVRVGADTVSFSVPYGGEKNAQVDLMFTANTEWAKFGYHSEAEGKSQYKGAIRNILLSAVASMLDEPGVDKFIYDGKELIVRVGRTFDPNVGLRRIFGFRSQKQRGGGYVKNMKATDLETLKGMYPDIDVEDGNIVVDDPQAVVTALFGEGVKPSQVRTAEQVIELIKSKFTAGQQEEIFKRAAVRARPLESKMKIPEEIA